MGQDSSEPLDREIRERWVSGHLYHHQSLDAVVRGFVHPLVVSLVRDEKIDAFFFLRYGLGGPHVRLRLRAIPGARDDVLETMQRSARRFLALEPSVHSLDEAVIRRWNESISAADPHAADDSVYPDNSFHLMRFRPEIERYGSPSRFRLSLDFFTLSSVAVLDHLRQHGDASRPARLAHAFALLLLQALGFAVDEEELSDLLRYGVDEWGERMPKVLAKGDEVARSRSGFFLRLFRDSLTEVRRPSSRRQAAGRPSDLLVAGAGRLSAAIGTERPLRSRIGGSHLHMTASRFGLTNAEEVYLSRLFTVTLGEVRTLGGEDLSRLRATLAHRAAESSARVDALIPPALAALAERARDGES